MRSKIIFVNSFKGGAGKTTLSLMHCITGLFSSSVYENVIYMDLAILGTATSYLFEDGRLPVEKCFDRTGKPVKIALTVKDKDKDKDAVDFSRGDAESTNGGMSPGQVIDISSHTGDA